MTKVILKKRKGFGYEIGTPPFEPDIFRSIKAILQCLDLGYTVTIEAPTEREATGLIIRLKDLPSAPWTVEREPEPPKDSYPCEAFIPTHLERCKDCRWFPGGLPNGKVFCTCGKFTVEEWKAKNGEKIPEPWEQSEPPKDATTELNNLRLQLFVQVGRRGYSSLMDCVHKILGKVRTPEEHNAALGREPSPSGHE